MLVNGHSLEENLAPPETFSLLARIRPTRGITRPTKMQPRTGTIPFTIGGCFLLTFALLLLTLATFHLPHLSRSTISIRRDRSRRNINPPAECLVQSPRSPACFRLFAQCTESSLVKEGVVSPTLSWWFLANHVTEWVRLDRLLGRTVYREDVMDFFTRTSVDLKRFLPGVENDYNDDALWWILALLEVYETYFEEQNTPPMLAIRRDSMLDTFLANKDLVSVGVVGEDASSAPRPTSSSPTALDPLDFLKIPIQAWFMLKQTQWDTERCYAGMFWRQDREKESGFYKATIANGLYLALSTKLYRITQREWFATDMVPLTIRTEWLPRLESVEGGLYSDGVDTVTETCTIRATRFTYNSAVVIGSLLDLWRATNNTEFLQQATQKASSALTYFTDGDFLLAPETNVGWSEDGVMFKAVFVRNLARLLEWISPMPEYQELTKNMTTFFYGNLDSLVQASNGPRCTWNCDWRGRRTRYRKQHASCQLAASSLFHANIFLSS